MSVSATPRDWLQGARPHTWANAVAPVLAGTAAAVADEGASFPRAVLAVLVSMSLIIGVNFANDYSDGVRGTDDDRTGPQRLTGSGLVPPARVKATAFACFGVAAVVGLVLSLMSAWWLIIIGALCILGAWFYTGGRHPYGYHGLGEAAVFVFFGLVAVLGTEFTQAGRISWAGFALAVGVGVMSASVNLANNLRDIPGDSAAGKTTLAVLLGDRRTRILWVVLQVIAVVATLSLATVTVAALIALVALPLVFVAALPVVRGTQGPGLIPVLGLTGRAMLVWSVAMLVAMLIA
ncbi:1,4-dihydroxy-2-naphthoate polyprenyltransferase [Corynebacterium bovis]|uniref:1,4-dihydroxy-2-naphthoate octaprenyltransferase n=1 Tax=Corynebacterium bovis TaxID=36808 RepID=A0A3R8PEK2_9CORY|nr:1,4-dihydroxy-2-naphthoate polyprenyltransferase [Corynebacterium bovis]RRO92000.1 1,4-dihydroxy-2-naphthoate polyprenyltransferase [Corynebacterium bovis]RRO93777.1 1,4-dihydroxy-2-naphthoate polyprenyltransferase [Corynebacterium bovis]RRO94148.1 1,4-dihydroxy-2-naphthoate polyprenyltransferase [Corynebacterium bovis]RRO97566.1 1,4-dihydroxy-2-naphthoate polyprenyltransferase [Corynebacterium bovis]RRQ01601.1 1,4-dihydroxy-2-naphthoate polyprenyltransferase [Corynebacterium bovis]